MYPFSYEKMTFTWVKLYKYLKNSLYEIWFKFVMNIKHEFT